MKNEIIKISKRGYRVKFLTKLGFKLYCYIIEGENHVYVYDTGCGDDDGKFILDFINDNFINKEIVVFNSHYHWDHYFGNNVFKDFLIYADRLTISKIKESYLNDLNENMIGTSGNVSLCLPNVVIDKELVFPEDNIRVIKTIGHTTDGIALLDEEDKILYIGDNIGDRIYDPIPELETSTEIYELEILKLKKLDFNVLASGHNCLLTKSFLDLILYELSKLKV